MQTSTMPLGLLDFERNGVDLLIVEPKVRTLVEALNFDGCTTVASCQGHASGGRTPYVLFRSEVPFASALERMVFDLNVKRLELRFFWEIQGIFDPQYRLCFRLYSPEIDRRTASLVQAARLLGLDRRQVDRDLELLARAVRALRGGDRCC